MIPVVFVFIFDAKFTVFPQFSVKGKEPDGMKKQVAFANTDHDS